MVVIDIPKANESESDIFDFGYDKSLVRNSDLASTPAVYDTIEDRVQGASLALGAFLAGAGNTMVVVDPTKGIWLGHEKFESAPFRVNMQGDLNASSGVFSGAITASSGTIGGFSVGSDYIRDAADSMGLASTVSGSDDVRFWAGDTFANRATAPFRVTEAGAVTGSSITITGGAITGTPIASIPNSTATDISLLEYTHDLAFSVTDKDTVAWATGTITMSNGRTFSITGSNTGNMAARTYIYLDTGVSSTALQTTTTASTAMGANKILIAVAQNGSAQAQYTVYGGIGGIKLPASGTSVSNNNWTYSGTWSVTDADTIAWGAGTLTTSDGGSYSITGSNTGNMAAKTYIYFDLGVSSTAFQTTTTAATAIGDGKILIAIAQNGTNEANYIVVNDKQHNIDAANIVTGSITANEIAAGAITSVKISVSQLSAISADMGSLTAGTIVLSSSGHIRAGQTAYDSGSGFFLGIESSTAKLSIGDSTGKKLTWSGTALSYNGATVRLGSSVTQTTITNTTTETNIFSVSVPANTLGTANLIRATIIVSTVNNVDPGLGTAADLTIRLKYDDTTVATATMNPNPNGTGLSGQIEAWLFANGSTSAQRGSVTATLIKNHDNPWNTTLNYAHINGTGTAVEDSAAAKNIIISVQWGGASTSNVFTYEGYIVEALLG